MFTHKISLSGSMTRLVHTFEIIKIMQSLFDSAILLINCNTFKLHGIGYKMMVSLFKQCQKSKSV